MGVKALSGSRAPLDEILSQDAAMRRVVTDHAFDIDAAVPLASGPTASIIRLRAPGSGALLEVAVTEEGRRQIRNEVAGRDWAGSAGVRTPAVLGHHPLGAWMMGECAAPAVVDIAYVEAVLEQAERIGRAAVPPPNSEDTRSWRSPRTSRAARAALVAAGGLSVSLFVRSRLAYQALAFDVPVHGDFYDLNVLRAADGHPTVVDWEYVARGPRFSDALRMWSCLPDPHLRDRVVGHLLGECRSAQERAQVGVVARWMVVRQIGENLSSLRHRSAENLAHARSLLPEALDLAARVGAP